VVTGPPAKQVPGKAALIVRRIKAADKITDRATVETARTIVMIAVMTARTMLMMLAETARIIMTTITVMDMDITTMIIMIGEEHLRPGRL
jgi:hypothetical protein